MSITPDMNLPVPEPGVTAAPDWGQQQQTAAGLIDTHDHSPGKGTTVPTAGLNINDDLSCHNYALKNVKNVTYLPQAGAQPNDSTFVRGVDLYYKDGNGNEVQITASGAVNAVGGGGGGTAVNFVTLASVASLRSVLSAFRNSLYIYQTAGYSMALDGGAATYQWSPTETRADDDAFCIRPNDVDPGAAGRFLYKGANGIFDASASPMGSPAPMTSYGNYLISLMKTAPSFGFCEIKLPATSIDVRDMTGDPRDPQYQGIANIKLSGRGAGKTRLTTITTYDMLHPQSVRLCSTAALPSSTAAGSGATKTLTATANGALSIDGAAVVNGDFVLLVGEANKINNGPYVVTQAGSAGTPWILTRAPWLNSSRALKARIGIFVTAGAANASSVFVLSNVASQWYSSASMTIDVSPQYWDLEPFVATHFLLQSGGEFQLYGGASSTIPTGWTAWMAPGERKWVNVQGLNGGTATDPFTGLPVNYTALQPGDVVYAAFGSDPTDQATPSWFRRCVVESIDAAGNVYVDTPVPSYSIDVTSLAGGPPYPTDGQAVDLGAVASVGTDTLTLSVPANAGLVSPGDLLSFGTLPTNGRQYAPVQTANAGTGVITFNPGTFPQYSITPAVTHAWQSKTFPPYNVDQQLLATTNKYYKVVPGRECRNVEICDITFDGVGPNGSFVENLSMHDVEINNVHATFFGICQSLRMKNIRMKNINGYSFPVSGGWYGWALQNNLCYDGVYEDIYVDGLSADLVDQEGGNETRWSNVNVILQPAPVFHVQFITGTTPNCIRQNPVAGLTVRGSYEPAIAQVTQPVRDMTWDVIAGTNGKTGWGGLPAEHFTGLLYYKGRRYALDQAKTFRTTIQLSGATTRTIRVPYQGLWSRTRFYATTLQGISSLFVLSFDALIGIRQFYRYGKWFDPGMDSFLQTYPNGFDDDLKSLVVGTDGTAPAGACLLFETRVVPEIDRGDIFSGVSTLVDARRMVQFQDQSIPEELYGAGAPGSVPAFAGQRYLDTAAGAIYVAVDVTGAGDWKKITP